MVFNQPDGVHAEFVAKPAFVQQLGYEVGVSPGVEIVREQDISKSHQDTINAGRIYLCSKSHAAQAEMPSRPARSRRI
jgi:hypothetical protein